MDSFLSGAAVVVAIVTLGPVLLVAAIVILVGVGWASARRDH